MCGIIKSIWEETKKTGCYNVVECTVRTQMAHGLTGAETPSEGRHPVGHQGVHHNGIRGVETNLRGHVGEPGTWETKEFENPFDDQLLNSHHNHEA